MQNIIEKQKWLRMPGSKRTKEIRKNECSTGTQKTYIYVTEK